MDFSAFIGGLAGLFVILAFYARNPKHMRVLAILSNILFILYAIAVGLWPVLALHVVLLPLNLWRLHQTVAPGPGQVDGPARLRSSPSR